MRRPLPALIPLLALCASACGPDEGPWGEAYASSEDGLVTTANVQVNLGTQSSTEAVRVQITGFTLYLGPLVQARTPDETGRRWVLPGRASKNLAFVLGFVPDDAFASPKIVSARKFEIWMDDHELNSILSGLPLFLRLDPTTGRSVQAKVALRPRLTGFSGSTTLRPEPGIRPVLAGDLRYRGRLTGSRLTSVTMPAVGGARPVVAREAGGAWRFDYSYDALAATARSGEPVRFDARSSGRAVTKTARPELIVFQAGLTAGDAYTVWPPAACDAAARRCTEQARAARSKDYGACGEYRVVNACLAEAPPAQDLRATFAADLREHLADYYRQHAADIAASNGRTLAQAQAAVDAANVTELASAEEDPQAHDFGAIRVFSHPDVVWPGSDVVWFGAYAREDGSLVEIYDFN